MNCEVCGVMEGEGACAECVALAREVRANDEVLAMLREESLPSVVVAMPRRRPVPAWVAAAAAAAVVLVAAAVPILRNRATPPKPRVALASRHPAREPLMVRILTPDPDVVILWQIDPEGGTAQ